PELSAARWATDVSRPHRRAGHRSSPGNRIGTSSSVILPSPYLRPRWKPLQQLDRVLIAQLLHVVENNVAVLALNERHVVFERALDVFERHEVRLDRSLDFLQVIKQPIEAFSDVDAAGR